MQHSDHVRTFIRASQMARQRAMRDANLAANPSEAVPTGVMQQRQINTSPLFRQQAAAQSDSDPIQFNDMFAAMAMASYAMQERAKVERDAAIEAANNVERLELAA